MIAKVTSVTKTFGSLTALNQVSMSVERGTVHGLVGPNGAGKTTLLSLLARLSSPTGGSVEVAAASLGVLPDTPLFDKWLTGREVVDMALHLSDVDHAPSKVDDVLEVVGLAKDKDRRVRGYSRGMLQRLGLASTFVTEPELLLLDEPAAALDPLGRREVLDLIGDLRGTSSVIFSSHILDDVQEVCDTIGILSAGSLVYEGSLDHLLSTTSTETRYAIEVQSGANDLSQRLIEQPWISSSEAQSNTAVVISGPDRSTLEEQLIPLLASLPHTVIGVVPVRRSLEDVFLEVTR